MEPEKELEILKLINTTLQSQVNTIELGGKTIKSLDDFEELIINSKVTAFDLVHFVYQLVGSFPPMPCAKDEFPTRQMKRKMMVGVREFLEQWPVTTKKERPIFMRENLDC